METARIILVEDHPIFRRGLVQLINLEDDMKIVGEADSVEGALDIIKTVPLDLAVVDITLNDSNGADLVRIIRAEYPGIKILVLSMHDETLYAEKLLRAGSMGYVMKQEAPEMIIQAIRSVMNDRVFVSDGISSTMLRKIIDGDDNAESLVTDVLTDREREIYTHIGKGLATREIADLLGVSIKTVENHRAHIKEKMGLKNSIELIQSATLWVQNGTV